MIKNFVFDMGNVLIDWNPTAISQRISKDQSEEILTYLFKSTTWLRLDEGLVTLEEGLKEILNATPLAYHEIISFAYNHWFEYVDMLDQTYDFIKKIKKQGYGIYMLSNCSQMFYRYYQTMAIFDLFDGYYVSADSQLLKPDVRIYQDFLKKFNLKGEECFFIDDVSENVNGAIHAGMYAFQYKKDVATLEEAARYASVITIKPHHLIDIVKLYGLGVEYFIPDEAFHHDFYRVANIIVNDPIHFVKFTIDGDDICQPCKHYHLEQCQDHMNKISKEFYNRQLDQDLFRLLGLSVHNMYVVKDVIQMILGDINVIDVVWKNEDDLKHQKRKDGFIKGANKLIG